jgi:hypothetical protein
MMINRVKNKKKRKNENENMEGMIRVCTFGPLMTMYEIWFLYCAH